MAKKNANARKRYDWSKVDPSVHSAEKIVQILGCSIQTARARIRNARGALPTGNMPANQKMFVAIWCSKQDAAHLKGLSDEEFQTELLLAEELGQFPEFPISGIKAVRRDLKLYPERASSGNASSAKIRALEARIEKLEQTLAGLL